MKKVNKKYLAAAIISGGIATLPLVQSASAATGNVQVKLKVAATSVNFTITGGGESGSGIVMDVPANSNVAESVTPLTITNNSEAMPVYVTNVKVDASKAASGYTNQAYGSDFASYSTDSKNWGLAITKVGSKTVTASDLKAGYTGNTTDDSIAAGASLNYTLAGKSSVFSTALTETKVGELTVTVAAK